VEQRSRARGARTRGTQAIWRLRDRSREIERILASGLGARHDTMAVRAGARETRSGEDPSRSAPVGRVLLALDERLEARIDRLAAEIRLTAEMNRDHDRVP